MFGSTGFRVARVIVSLGAFLVFLDACYGEVSPNLLKNPGFEEGFGEEPAEWWHFIATGNGAEAVWDSAEHHSGTRSVKLRTKTPYAEQVYNNWYQHVPVATVGAKLYLSGYIKGNEVADAAIWIQCWRDSSQEPLSFATTSMRQPVRGTTDWTQVETSLVLPPGTAFLTIRCVISGTGAAWFDDLQLVVEEGIRETPLAQVTATGEGKSERDTLNDLLEAHKILLETNKSLTENVKLLMEEVAKLRDELKELRVSLDKERAQQGEKDAPAGGPPETVSPGDVVPGDTAAPAGSESAQ